MGEDFIYHYRKKRMVLVVDDEEINREILGGILEDHYEVQYASDGEEALEIIKEKGNLLSLVLLDIMMPKMDGFEVIKNMQMDPALRPIPVIVLTSDEELEIDSLKKGAADFIKKPYDVPEKILARVKRIIALFEDRLIIQLTEKDELTNLYDRSYFYEYALLQNRFNPDEKMDAVVFNISHFHMFNEIYGMEEGDKILQVLAKSIEDMAERFGGIAGRSVADIFMLYIPSQKEYDSIHREVEDAIEREFPVHHVRVRIGVYTRPDNNDDKLSICFDRAKTACNSIRENYNKDVAYFDDELREKQIYAERLIHDIRSAISKNQLKVYFQSKYDVTGDIPVITSAEALVRWIHPELGMISPGSFITLFEENGLIHLVDEFVWKESAERVKRWKEEFGITLPVSVNVSRIDLHDPQIKEKLLKIVKDAGITPEDIYLEITESVYEEDTDQMVEVVMELKKAGFVIEMDDFGSGYSSLNMLTTMPFDILKLDMSLMKDIHKDERSRRMLELIIEIAKFLKVKVVAEGVEEKQQVEILKKFNAQVIQGYYFSRPVPPEEFEALLKNKR
ncbi:MAG: EAL domain-containing protein [Lachnospiraceae bacterium]|nr:EAL domain-containing protein [Lachnospiraceae bacterium]